MNAYERTLFQRAKIERWQDNESEFDSKEELFTVAENTPVGLAQKNSSVADGNGNVVVKQYFLLHTLFADIKASDIITVTDPSGTVEYGRFRAGKPYPVMDVKGVHHYEVVLEEEADA